ncbi:hypothetical protein BSKO_07406 [Bryopsis sp. KO-2023]|nr:hypothetical protein BSKO_07406 [Bryopsis sp. KO-2023]
MAFTGAGQKSTPLHKAARRGNEDEVLRLLRQGADVTARDAEGRTPLHLAVMRGHMGIIQRLLEHGGPAVLLSRDILSCTPVHLAAVQNQVRLISMLIEALLQDTAGCTPLHEVAQRGCMQDFMGFLHLGWDLASCDGRNQEALQLTEDASKPGFAAVQQILGWSVLHLAAMEGQVSHIEKLVRTYDWDVHVPSANSWTPLHYAAAYNQVGSIEALVRLGAKVDIRDSVGSTPLHVACGEGHMPAVLKLIELGCDPAVKDRDGCTPLYCAAAWNRIEVVRELHKLGCPSWVQSEEGRTAVHVAAEQGWVGLIEVLVMELGSDVDSRDTCKFTPLHSAANWGWVEAIQKLVELKHEVDVKDYLGRTPLHYAALHGRAGAIEDLAKLGASLQETDSRGGYTPLHLAADAGQCEAVATLVNLGADTEARTAKGWTCLQLATMKGPANVDVLGLLVELGADVKAVTDNKNMETPLHIAARAGRLDIVQKLINCGVSVTARTKDGSTPLHYAAAFGQAHVLEALVKEWKAKGRGRSGSGGNSCQAHSKAGCDVHTRDNAQNTPLHLAAGCGFLEAVMKLVELGGDLNSRDMSDCTPLQNTAHGTYSALAQVPSGVTAGPNGQLQGLGSLSLRRSGLSSAVLPGGPTAKDENTTSGGMVPVRTGFAWATLGRSPHSWKGAELMSLLRKATRSRRAGSLLFGSDLLHDTKAGPDELRDDDDDWDRWSHRDLLEKEREGLEVLLKKTEALQLSQMEQDRSRLIPVAEKIVELGADVSARDNEGRTALHLAAGCEDKNMVIKLVELGADINCRDSVGGTPMHHAAMANKKEMMFTLARLGNDWRARADGIDGATAAFVLCGQHGKTTRQQLLEAKLKRVFLEGEAARKAGRDPFEVVTDSKDEEPEEDLEELAERADANMAALLEEEEAKAVAAKRKRKKKNRKGKALDSAEAGSGDGLASENGAKARGSGEGDGKEEGGGCDNDGNSRTLEGSESDAQQAVRWVLDEAIVCANTVLEIGAATGRDAMLDVLEKLDDATQKASQANVSAKYAKKIRKRLQALMEDNPSLPASDSVGSGNDSREGVDPGANEGWAVARKSSKQCLSRPSTTSADLGKSQSNNESEWQQVGSQGKKFNSSCGVVVMPKGSVHGGRPGQTRHHGNRRSSQMSRGEPRIIRSPVVAAGSVVVRTGNVVVVKAAPPAAPSAPPPSTPAPPPQAAAIPAPAAPPALSRPAWNHGAKSSALTNSMVASDPDFPPLQSSTSEPTRGAPKVQEAGSLEPSASSEPPNGHFATQKTANVRPIGSSPQAVPPGNSSTPQTTGHLKPYELFGESGRLAGPVSFSTGSSIVQSPGSVWSSRTVAGSPYGVSEEPINGTSAPGMSSIPRPQAAQSHVKPHPRGDVTQGGGQPIPPPQAGFHSPFPGQHPGVRSPYGLPPNRVMDPGMWQVPMPFGRPLSFMSGLSSVGHQAMNGGSAAGSPFGMSPGGGHLMGQTQSSSYDSLMQPRFQPPPPPGPPPHSRGGGGVGGICGSFGGNQPGSHNCGPYEPGSYKGMSSEAVRKLLPEHIPGQVDGDGGDRMDMLTMEDSSEAARRVSRHLLGELEAEIGF